MTCGDSTERTKNVARRIRRQGRRGSRLRTDDLLRTGTSPLRPRSCSQNAVLPGRRFGRSWRIFAYSTSSNFGLVLGRVDENMRQDGHPVAEPLVDVLGDVLGPVGADVVAEGHPGSDDHALRAQVHRAQFDNLVDTLGGPDL